MINFLLFTAVVAWTFGWAAPAHAYVDPGTGSMLLQLLLGGVAGALVVVKLHWVKIKNFFVRKPASDPTTENEQTGK